MVVTINYRLGIFGFFAHPELTKESDVHASGNYGLLDMIAALRWVNRSILGERRGRHPRASETTVGQRYLTKSIQRVGNLANKLATTRRTAEQMMASVTIR